MKINKTKKPLARNKNKFKLRYCNYQVYIIKIIIKLTKLIQQYKNVKARKKIDQKLTLKTKI